ncbi:hypothetical protein [Polyangium aurulentum]|uniref:hypothetical protein n=1 Tax=Polyangium aurulentum TaxID=2567896 RepID=UPI0010AEA96E|nr:hypothetical protein [Polyangium aurulentum]UQA61440.1 hypothetical protein E8A73_013570 [Polyangium aurulentum]
MSSADELNSTAVEGTTASSPHTPDEALAEIVERREQIYAPSPEASTPRVCMSFGRMHSDVTFPMQVEVPRIAELLNEISDASVAKGLHDVQFWLQQRTSKAGAPDTIHGAVIDIDAPATDVLGEVERAGMPMPAACFQTLNGYKLIYALDSAVNAVLIEQIAKRLTLGFEGGDPGSWSVSQGQRLPKCLRTTASGVILVDFKAQLANPIPLTSDIASVPFPRRVMRALGGWSPAPADRERIREYLAEMGIPAPESAGHALYAACPVSEEHDSKCCYVNVDDNGAISVTCLGGHGGEGKKYWSEANLLMLAAGDAAAGEATFDPFKDLPVTWAARELFEYKLRDWPAPLRHASFEVWVHEKARLEAKAPEALDVMLAVYRHRLMGDREFGPVRPYYSEVEQKLAYDDAAGRRSFVNCKDSGPSTKSNLHECQATAAWTICEEAKKDGSIVHVPEWAPTTSSLMNKSTFGQRAALRVLGVPAITRYDLPVAHVEDGWGVEPRTKVVTATKAFQFPAGVVEIPALEFFLKLFRDGRLPLASENDVRLFVACLAAPLLRDIGRGQLGIWWVIGPPGAGKDYLAEMCAGVWEAVSPRPLRVSFDINVTNDFEMKRSFAAAEGAVYARAKEAGKRLGMIETLIRTAGTNTLTARGMKENERSIPNAFVILADSAEDLPDRREISRRTVMISVADMDDSISKGAVLDEVKKAAPGLLLNLKRLVESKSPEWYLRQTDTGSRLLIPVALTRLLGATLPEVQGQDLSDIFEAMRDFIATPTAKEEGEHERKKAVDRGAKESAEMKTLPSYRISLFIDQMKGIAGYKDLFVTYGDKARSLATRIMRESGYAAVRTGKLPYLAVPIGSTDYAFKLTRSHRNFILVPKAEYDNKVLPGQAGGKGGNALPSSTPRSASSPQGAGAEGTASSPDAEQGQKTEPSPLVFNDADLLNEEVPSSDDERAS